MNTNAQTMAWFMDAYSAGHGYTPAHRHRQAGRPSAASPAARRRRASASSSSSRRTPGSTTSTSTGCPSSIQGFGNVGSFAGEGGRRPGLPRSSASPTASAASTHESGLDVAVLIELVARPAARSPTTRARTTRSPTRSCSSRRATVLIPAALDEQLHEDNAGEVQAHGRHRGGELPDDAERRQDPRRPRHRPSSPTSSPTPAASRVRTSSGPATSSRCRGRIERFNEALQDYMVRAYDATSTFAKDTGCSLRQAAFAIGIQPCRRRRTHARLHLRRDGTLVRHARAKHSTSSSHCSNSCGRCPGFGRRVVAPSTAEAPASCTSTKTRPASTPTSSSTGPSNGSAPRPSGSAPHC